MSIEERKVCITVPKEFVWLARQYSGEWFVFTHKPTIGTAGDFFDDEMTKPIEWWDSDIGEVACLSHDLELSEVPDWKDSLRYIGE